jgi:hypothetical protein
MALRRSLFGEQYATKFQFHILCFNRLEAVTSMVSSRSGVSYQPTPSDYGRKAREKASNEKKRKKLEKTTDPGARTTRSRTVERETIEERFAEHAAPPFELPQAQGPPQRRLRSEGGPVCSDYGLYRFIQYAGMGYFFCHQCDLWDNENKLNSRIQRKSLQYACKANHTSFSHPTDRRLADPRNLREQSVFECPQRHDDTRDNVPVSSVIMFCQREEQEEEDTQDDENDEDEEDVEDDPPEQSVVETLEQNLANYEQREIRLKFQVSTLKAQVEVLQKRDRKLTKRVAFLKGKQRLGAEQLTIKESNNVFYKQTTDALTRVVVRYHRWGTKRVGNLLGAVFWAFLDGIAQKRIIESSKKWLRKNVFTPYNILKRMDFAGGTLSYEGIEILRLCETDGKKYYQGSLLPSSADIKRFAVIVGKAGAHIAPFDLIDTEHGEGIAFDRKKTVMASLKAFGLSEIAKVRRVLIGESIDGSNITKHIHHTMGGFKILDPAAKCPITKNLLLSDGPGHVQSRNNCIPLMIIMGKESKQMFETFRPMFQFFDSCASEDVEKNPLLSPEGMKPLNVAVNCDLAACWRGLQKGGGAKVHTLPCHCCPILSSELVNPASSLCGRWCQDIHTTDGWKCYHHSIADETTLGEISTELLQLTENLVMELDELQKKSKLSKEDPNNPTAAARKRKNSIHFEPDSQSAAQGFSRLLTDALILRNQPIDGSLVDRRNRLKEALVSEHYIRQLRKKVQHCDNQEAAFFFLMQAIPCILHLENRTGLKLFTQLVVEGISNASKQLIFTDVGSEQVRIERYVAKVEEIVNCQIHGTPQNPAHWVCPMSDDRKELGIICMANDKTRSVCDSLELLINASVVDPRRKLLWESAISHFRISLKELRRKEDFTDEQIIAVQKKMDLFFQDWVDLQGIAGSTNYFHMMGSGHIADYLFKWRNLYRHSQQGWEAFNMLLKTFFFRRTAHGGAVNRGAGLKSRLLPVGRWLQRRLVFMCGYDEQAIRDLADLEVDDVDDDEGGDIHVALAGAVTI